MICPLLLINGIDDTILWAGLAKRSKEISCSRNLVAARDFYDARQTFYTSSYENLVEKSARHASVHDHFGTAGWTNSGPNRIITPNSVLSNFGTHATCRFSLYYFGTRGWTISVQFLTISVHNEK